VFDGICSANENVLASGSLGTLETSSESLANV
jgi:hypothetical protein